MALSYMKMYWGDYHRDTAHLSVCEHGAYLLLISHYWNTGSIPKRIDQLARIWRVDERTAADFWEAISGYFGPNRRHKRIDAERRRALEISGLRAKASKVRWRKNT